MDYLNLVTLPGFLLLLLLLLLLKHCSSFHGKPSLHLPPGPWQLPLIGSLHHIVARSSLPHQVMRDLSRVYGPLMLLRLGEVNTLVVSSAEAASEVMKAHDASFASRYLSVTLRVFSYGGRDVLFAPYNDAWRQLRKICVLELFNARRVLSFRPIREDEVRRLVCSIADVAASGGLVNISEKVHALMNDMVVRAAIGGRCKHRDEFLHELDNAVRLTGGFNLADLYPSSWLVRRLSGVEAQAERCYANVCRIAQSIIQERTTSLSGEDDLLGVLLRIQKDGGLQFPLTTEIITAVIFDIFAAGSETSSTTLDWAISELMKNPHVLKKAQTEVWEAFKGQDKLSEDDVGKLTYLPLVIKETLRLHAPAPLLLPRECRERCRVIGYDVPMGTKVLVNVWAIGRDAKYWEDAEVFKPERFHGSIMDFRGADFEFIPFGAGRRICPGMMMGLANIELALASLLYHFDWKLPEGVRPEDLDMAEAFGITVRRAAQLWLTAKPRTVLPAPN